MSEPELTLKISSPGLIVTESSPVLISFFHHQNNVNIKIMTP